MNNEEATSDLLELITMRLFSTALDVKVSEDLSLACAGLPEEELGPS